MARNMYEVLGVGEDAGQEEIKAAFRERAKILHPDKGGDEEAFKELNEAYRKIGSQKPRGVRKSATSSEQTEDAMLADTIRTKIAQLESGKPARQHVVSENVVSEAPKRKFGELMKGTWNEFAEFAKKAGPAVANTGRVGGGALAGVGAAAAATFGLASRFGGTLFRHLGALVRNPGTFFEQIGSRYTQAMADPPQGQGRFNGFFSATGWMLFGDKPQRKERKEGTERKERLRDHE